MKVEDKKLKFKRFIVYIGLLLILVGCQQEVNMPAQMNMSLCLPIQDVPMRKRVMGDPGTSEQFELPKYAYIFVMKNNGGGTWSVWRREERQLAEEDWVRTRYYGRNNTREDSIFKYNKEIQLLLNGEQLTGRVYAICSNMKLNFNTAFNSVSNLTQLLDWKFNSSPDSIQRNLQNIYSTPYNYTRDGQYYCSFDCSAGTSFNVDLIMYHIASKVDIKWYVDEDKRINSADPSSAVRLTHMEARYLFDDYAYCFQPMRNEKATLPTSGYTIEDIVTADDEGLWWEGRAYFYTIPYVVTGNKDYFPLQMEMETNESGNSYRPTIQLGIDTSNVFVPWLRANFSITAPLEDKAETKTPGE